MNAGIGRRTAGERDKIPQNLRTVGVPLLMILGKASGQYLLQVVPEPAFLQLYRRGFFVQDLVKNRRVVPLKRLCIRKELVQDDTE